MIKAIVFDCFGVLATDIWLEFLDSLPETVDKNRLLGVNRAYDRGIISLGDYNRQIFEETGLQAPDLKTANPSGINKNHNLLEFIKKLKSDYKIGLLSNISSDWITSEFLSQDEQKLFDTIVLSFELGLTKPDPRIYEITCQRLGYEPQEVLMIDDREAYVHGAKDMGMQGIVYTGMQKLTQDLSLVLNSDN
jgi:putative hydrolase of the HAD superfamily